MNQETLAFSLIDSLIFSSTRLPSRVKAKQLFWKHMANTASAGWLSCDFGTSRVYLAEHKQSLDVPESGVYT